MMMFKLLPSSLSSSLIRSSLRRLLSSSSSSSSLSLSLIDLNDYISKNRSTLKPPVANKLMFDCNSLKIMIVGGPNQRDDYHIEKGEELFIQLQGHMDLDIMDNNKFRRIRISEGEMFVLPPCIPHSPQRYANSIGLVFERVRYQGENDALRWYVPNTNKVLYEEVFACTDLGTQLKPVIERYQNSIENTTKIPSKDISPCNEFDRDINLQKYELPFILNERINESNGKLINSYEYVVDVWKGSSSLFNVTNGDLFLWQSSGESEITTTDNKESFALKEGQVAVLSSSKLLEISIKQSNSSDKLITIYNKATK
jgi:3-hydroxyanthranilate 3,4-dioxygenase